MIVQVQTPLPIYIWGHLRVTYSQSIEMAEQTIVDNDPTRWTQSYVYQDGTYHRTNPRSPPEWNRSVAVGVLFSILLLVALIVIGVFFFNDSAVKRVIFNQNILSAPVCKADPAIGYRNFCAEDTLISPDHKYLFHAGRLSFTRAQRACAALPGGGGGNLTTIHSERQEKRFDSRIENLRPILFVNDETVFAGFRKQIWTGGYIDLELDGTRRMRWIDEAGLSEWRLNFCEPKQATEILKFSFDEFNRYGAITNPLIYVVKDYRPSKNGCWQLYSPFVYETEHLEFSFVCQVSKAGLPFLFKRNFLGEFRPDETNGFVANEYAAFSGRNTYSMARETCQYLASGVEMIAPKTSALDAEINKGVELYSSEIFGEDNGDPQRRKLIWTGGYFNLSSKNPTKIRWADDPDTLVDTAEPAASIGFLFGSSGSNNKLKDYENFCGTVEYYQGLIKKALNEDGDVENGCIRERLFLIVKDFREEQSVQGCWAVYDLDYLNRHDYKLFLVCKLPYPVSRKE